MNKFFKTIDGKEVIKNLNNIILYKNGKQIINPTIEMVKNDGWEEYIEPTEEVDEEMLIKSAKWELIEKINAYENLPH